MTSRFSFAGFPAVSCLPQMASPEHWVSVPVPQVRGCVFTDYVGSLFCYSLKQSVISEKCRVYTKRNLPNY